VREGLWGGGETCLIAFLGGESWEKHGRLESSGRADEQNLDGSIQKEHNVLSGKQGDSRKKTEQHLGTLLCEGEWGEMLLPFANARVGRRLKGSCETLQGKLGVEGTLRLLLVTRLFC